MADGEKSRSQLITELSALRRYVSEMAPAEEENLPGPGSALFLSYFLQYCPTAAAVLDRELRYITVSRRWQRDFNLREDVTGRLHTEVLPDLPESWGRAYRPCLAGTAQSSEAEPYRRADGALKIIRWEMQPWYGADGEIGGLMIFVEDITESRRVRSESFKYEELYRSIARSMPGYAMTIFGPELRYLLVEGAIITQAGFSPSLMVGHRMDDILPEALHSQFMPQCQAVLQGETQDWEINFGVAVYRNFAVPIYDRAGEIVAGLALAQESQEDTGRLEQQARTLSQVLSAMPEYVFLLDSEQRFLYINPAAAELWGLKNMSYMGRRPDELKLTAGQKWPHTDYTQQVIESGQPVIIENTLNFGERTGHYRCMVAPIFDAQGEVRSVLIASREITEEKLAAAQQRADLLRQFMQDLAHDLKTPLSAAQISIELLGRYVGSSGHERVPHHLQMIKQQIKRLQNMVDDMRVMARLDTEQDEVLELQLLDMCTVVQAAVEALQPMVEKRGHRLELQFLPQPLPVMGDEEYLRRMVTNLVANALNYTPGGGRISIRLDAAEDSGCARLAVTDTGIGIEPEALPRLYERFFRTERARATNTGGTGLGLPIVKRVLDLHGGHIKVQSTVDVGSTFTVYVPLHLQQAQVASAAG